ncbi:archaetidylserine decarboxylase [Sulfuricella sp. T08]|uniref:archaetidylserine decarboxylase n=1 Tax=Sulfuricella sp. T08 TaxID=1632857 RepID=UPI001ED9854D|nr:archaetidylserine decarboxylase [Sulfuricella sp. T08]
MRKLIAHLVLQEDINFLLTNRVPRQLLTRFMGWFSQIEQPLVRDLSIATWKLFADLDLSDARKTKFRSLHDCFTRQLRDGARPLDTDPSHIVSPSDGIVGACGAIAGTEVIQAKGFPYTLLDLLGDPALVEHYRDGCYVTLRLTSSMYHRFHSPHDCLVQRVTYISGDTWNVNPIALKRVEKLFCKNERALIETTLNSSGHRVTLVPVAAILVASIRLHFLNVLLHLRYRGPNVMPCHASFAKGDEMGWFQHGSTIIVFAPKGFTLIEGISDGTQVRMGQALFHLPESNPLP